MLEHRPSRGSLLEPRLSIGESGSTYPVRQVPAASRPQASSFVTYFAILNRHRWFILIFVFLSVVAAFFVSKRMTPLYEATITIDVDRQTPTGLIGADESRPSSTEMDNFIATQIKILQSDSVLRPVVEKYGLLPLSKSGHGYSNGPVELPRLKVSRPPNTYLIQVTYRHPNPVTAANVSNGIAASYLEHTYRTRIAAWASLYSFSERQMQELKAKMERSSADLLRFQRELDLINPDEKTNILSARLLQLNTDYAQAQAEAAAKEAAYRSLEQGNVEAAQASPQGEALKRLSERENDAMQKLADIKVLYAENHPEYRRANAQVSEVRKQLAAAKQAVLLRVEAQYKESAMRVGMLKTAVADTKLLADKLNAHSFDYQILKERADADKRLYEELVRKVGEAQINAGLQNNGTRISDPARPADKPVTPNVPLYCLVAFALSGLMAGGLVILRDSMDSRLRTPEDVRQTCSAEVMSVLPSLKSWRKRPLVARLPAPLRIFARRDSLSADLAQYAEALRMLRGCLLTNGFDRNIRSLLVVSPWGGEGRSTIAANLASSYAQLGKKTLVIDGDLRQPTIHRLFMASAPELGLSNVLSQEANWRDAVVSNTSQPNLDLLGAGPSADNICELVHTGLGSLIEEASRIYDLVVLDSPPFLNFAESLEMAKNVDGVLVVARAGSTDQKSLAAVLGSLHRLRIRISGLALNDFA